MSKSKSKGTRDENKLAEKLNAIPGVTATRVVGSGMFAGGDETSEYFGDVRAATPAGPIIFEAKYRTKSLWKTLVGWLGSHDILVCRAIREEPYVFMPFTTFAGILAERQRDQVDSPAIDGIVDADELAHLIKEYLSDISTRNV